MRIYVAGRVGNIQQVRALQLLFTQRGHEITYDWTGPEGETRRDWSGHREEACEIAQREVDGVASADAVALVGYGCEEQNKGGLGCFIEVGMALAAGKPVAVWGPARESVFWYLPNVYRHVNGLDVVERLEIVTGQIDIHTA